MTQASADAFRALGESTPDAIVVASQDNSIVYFNPGAEAMFGYAAAEVVGKPIPILMPERHREAHRAGFARHLATGEERVIGSTVELEGRRKDGSEFPIELSLSSWGRADGVFFTGSIRDITERKHAEEEVRRAREEADRANQAKSEFLSRMSHELRTPLNAILGYGQLLEMEDLAPGDRESVEHILKAGRHLTELINEVLDISKIEAGRLSLSIEPVPAGETVHECVSLVRPMAEGRAIVLDIDPAPDCFVLADRQRLKQILLNLLSNAVKYDADGGRVTVRCRQAADDAVRLEVTDTGPGIPPDRLGEVFVPFQRLGAENTGVEGTGLGLALSKGLADAMGGALGVESEPGVGSTFWLELPRAERPEEPVIEPEAAPSGSGGPERARTVLYVEDNLPNVGLVERALGRLPGVRVLTAMQGQMGLDLAREHRPDLILLDLHLPDLSGEEVLGRLQADPATRDIPVVVVSADATPGRVSRLIAGGARSYLTKPLDIRRLLKLVGELDGDQAVRRASIPRPLGRGPG